ncbi:MAG: methylated-DNA--[protein]-cysteine S-methyltransferase [Ignavibacteriaceae bacterium]|jgi:AraC family transcriptional regulator of adaptative response/methylated-DNA-[protein]-cysteine methyltransferase
MISNINYNRIEKAIQYIAQNYKLQPSLEDMAKHVNVSEFHFQRIFTEWAGISPKKFLQFLTIEELKKELTKSKNLIDAANNVGLSAQSRVYDLFVKIEAVTPNEYKTRGKGISIDYGIHNTPFGSCLLAVTERGICSINFIEDDSDNSLDGLHQEWENATIRNNQKRTKEYSEIIFDTSTKKNLKLLVRGTKFQVKVWEALLKIPFGSVTNYQTIANIIKNPGAVRAVSSAIGNNPVAYVIPCHRVIRREGLVGQYHWGAARKAVIIGWEKSKL